MLEDDEWTPMTAAIPVADGAAEARLPVEGKEQQRSIIVVDGDVDCHVDRTGNAKPEELWPPSPPHLPA